MVVALQTSGASRSKAGSTFSPIESARYTADILKELRTIATAQNQPILAHLLELAQAEALIQTRDQVPV